jgi:hypothetical protein
MRRAALLVAVAILVPVAGCGDGGDGSGGDGSADSGRILRPVRTFFLFDRSPDYNAYCRSYVEVSDQHTFRQGSPQALAPEAAATQRSCLRAAEQHVLVPNHTGYPDTQIGEVRDGKRKGRATVSLTLRTRGKTVPAKALVARIKNGDWRVLRGGWGD